MANGNVIYGHLISMWGIQDSLLQSYRNIFLTSQAVLFSVAVFVAQGPRPLLSILLSLIGLPLVWLWRNIVVSRGYDVWFYHLRMLRLEGGQEVEEKLFTAFKEWQRLDTKLRKGKLAADPYGKELIHSLTRSRLDFYLPLAFALCWTVLCFIAIWLAQKSN